MNYLVFKLILNFFCIKLVLSQPTIIESDCVKNSVTTASGSQIKKFKFCPGELIFEDNFDTFDFEKWQHENTLSGGGNWEFQWYTNDREISYTANGNLHIKPMLTSKDDEYLKSAVVNINGGSPANQCTDPSDWGCERTGGPKHIINPIRSAKLRTIESFNFKFGRVEFRAKLPSGDWMWPAIWLLSKRNPYGIWPASGEIDIVESRGNKNLFLNDVNIGAEQITSTLNFGPDVYHNGYKTSYFTKNSLPNQGYDVDFHKYELIWTPEYIKFIIDDEEIGVINVDDGFWKRGNFPNDINNPWENNSLMAPFDQEFYMIINVAVGGITYFPDRAKNLNLKPWLNNSTQASTDFWNGRDSWLPTWNLNDKNNFNSTLLIDYIRVYAI